ncbi:MAG: hypothetical protein JJ895_03055 [Balneolaceae bacterium]|nr:hypothetical protein [Balneolaceae bacterium]
MKYILSIVVLVLATNGAQAQAPFEREETSAGIFGLSITNFGTLGKPDVRNNPEGGPSMRYPIDTGTEHLFEGGIWIGAKYNNAAIRVSTASVTTGGGYARGAAGFEFTANAPITKRSTDPDNEFFSPFSVGQEDIITEFTDRRRDVNGTPIGNHDTPLYADVRLESYNWSFPFTENFTIVRYDITNNSTIHSSASTWDSVFIGMYADLVVRNVNTTTETGGEFFNKNGLGYLDSLYTAYVFDAGSPDNPAINTYGAMSIIGADYRGEFFHPSNPDTVRDELSGRTTFQQSGYNVPFIDPSYWLFSQGTGLYVRPNDDQERYDRMATKFPLDSVIAGQSVREQLRTDGQNGNGNYISMMSIGPFPTVEPGETISVYFAFSAALKPEEFQGQSNKKVDNEESRANLTRTIESINRVFQGEDRNSNGRLDPGEDTDENGELTRYLFPTPPDDPNMRVVLDAGKVTLYWDKSAEASVDRVSGEQDFEGYRVYRSELGEDLNPQVRMIREFDVPGNQEAFNTGFDEIELDEPVTFEGDTTTYYYAFEINDLLSGWQYELSVTAFDRGSDTFEIEGLETSPNVNAVRVFPGTPANENFTSSAKEYQVGVYPNPYRVNAAWDGSLENERKLYFYNLPARAEVRIYTVAGDIVGEFTHDSDTYNGDIGWFSNYSDDPRVLAGGEHAWDLQSNANQILTTGLYLYTVKDMASGEVQTGKIVIIK